jgi:glyoxylase-like metal-dependent hydrolase (beta-lactamase superfamily II)
MISDAMDIHSIGGRGFSGNIFLIDAEEPCLVDAGMEQSIFHEAARVAEILDGRKLRHIILTHRHIDHVGGALAFQREFGGEILVHRDDAEALRTGDQDSTGARMFGGEIEPMPVKEVQEGDAIDLGGGEKLAVLHTPGHTIGSMCLISGENLLTGDTVFSDGGVGRWDFETGSYDQLLASIEKLGGMQFENMYPGHGPVVIGTAKEHVAMSLRSLRMMGRFG